MPRRHSPVGPASGLARGSDRSEYSKRSPEPGRRPIPLPDRGRSPQPSPYAEPPARIRLGRVELAGRGTAQWGRHRLPADSVEALRLVGTFGTVDVGDLADMFRSARRLRGAVSELQQVGLLRVERFRRGRRVVDAATLTRAGKRLMERLVDPRQPGDEDAHTYRAGPARSTQVLHDTAVFRAARREARAIEAVGGRIRRIRTDQDLQRLAWRRFQSARRGGATRKNAQASVAESLHLSVYDGKLTFPDVRIEYDPAGPDGTATIGRFVDVEVATPDYRQRALRAKQAAGFRVYSMNSDGGLGLDASGTELAAAR